MISWNDLANKNTNQKKTQQPFGDAILDAIHNLVFFCANCQQIQRYASKSEDMTCCGIPPKI